jgi:hypothetical protein
LNGGKGSTAERLSLSISKGALSVLDAASSAKLYLLGGYEMHRLLPLFACLMLVLTLWAGTAAHAAESLVAVENASSMTWEHSPGDADEVPADADKAVPHHHGLCHGHDVGFPLEFNAPIQGAIVGLQGIRPVPTLGTRQTDPALRPPNA